LGELSTAITITVTIVIITTTTRHNNETLRT